MIDNFKQISNLLSFNSDDEFYFVQLIQRKKDNKGITGSNNKNRIIKVYYITSIDQLLRLKDEMVHLADYFNARVGINLNKRSFEKTAYNTLIKMSNQMQNKDFKSVKTAYNSSCGIYNSVNDKTWILDIDDKDDSYFTAFLQNLNNINPIGNKLKDIIPSKNGYHILTSPFDVSSFNNFFSGWSVIPKPDIHKNNPTNLYIS